MQTLTFPHWTGQGKNTKLFSFLFSIVVPRSLLSPALLQANPSTRGSWWAAGRPNGAPGEMGTPGHRTTHHCQPLSQHLHLIPRCSIHTQPCLGVQLGCAGMGWHSHKNQARPGGDTSSCHIPAHPQPRPHIPAHPQPRTSTAHPTLRTEQPRGPDPSQARGRDDAPKG